MSTELTTFLAQAREHLRATTSDQEDLKSIEAIELLEASVADVPTLLAIIDVVLSRHRRHQCERDGNCLCGEQKEFCACGEEWPCITRAQMCAVARDATPSVSVAPSAPPAST